MSKQILVKPGIPVIVDDEDYDELMQYKWFIEYRNSGGIYVVRRGDPPPAIYMSRQLLGLTENDGLIASYIDKNNLNNQKSNLRIITRQQGSWDRRPIHGKSSRYKGVWRTSGTGRRIWEAGLRCNGKYHYLRRHATEIEAALAYDAAARIYFGEFAFLNFP